MARIRCEVAKGLREAEATISVREYDGSPQHFPLDRGLISKVGDETTIPVRLLQYNEEGSLALVILPVEADSGTHRIWVRADSLIQALERVG